MNQEIAALKIEHEGAASLPQSASLLRHAAPGRDVTDIYRASLAKMVSGYDRFLHQLVYRGLLEAAADVRPQTDAFGRFKVSLLSALPRQKARYWPIGLAQRSLHSTAICRFRSATKLLKQSG